MDTGKAVEDIKKGMVEYKTDSYGNVHTVIGKASFDDKKLLENLDYVVSTINKTKPSVVKGKYIENITIASTMGPGVKVDKNSFDN
jgi:large subunit ribosomal protein L1